MQVVDSGRQRMHARAFPTSEELMKRGGQHAQVVFQTGMRSASEFSPNMAPQTRILLNIPSIFTVKGAGHPTRDSRSG